MEHEVFDSGRSGFLGSQLSDALLQRGDECFIIDSYAIGRRGDLTLRTGLAILEDTVADKASVDIAFDSFQPEVAIRATASYKIPDGREEDARTNVEGGINVAKAAKRVNVRRLIAGRHDYDTIREGERICAE